MECNLVERSKEQNKQPVKNLQKKKKKKKKNEIPSNNILLFLLYITREHVGRHYADIMTRKNIMLELRH